MAAAHFKITLLEYACKCVVSIFLESNGCAEFDSEMTGYLKVIAAVAPTCNCSNLSTKQQMYVKLAEICSRIQKQTLFIEKGHCFIDLVKSCCDALYSLQDVEEKNYLAGYSEMTKTLDQLTMTPCPPNTNVEEYISDVKLQIQTIVDKIGETFLDKMYVLLKDVCNENIYGTSGFQWKHQAGPNLNDFET
ncbi:uncharacterized protein LOC135686193 [Rhopilema esculentum]|uniref:uncharacterized protein LOC135686193 n=1 Tax=Rhopilema esculentum TaxID=499914 RepID=UPI0031D9D5EE